MRKKQKIKKNIDYILVIYLMSKSIRGRSILVVQYHLNNNTNGCGH